MAEAENNFVRRLSTVALDGRGLTAVTGPATTRTASCGFDQAGRRRRPHKNVTEWPRTARTPAWAPGGNALAFHSLGDIYVATLDGGIVNLTRSPEFREFTPDWTQ